MNKKYIKSEPASREAQINCGLDFPGYGNGWSTAEMLSNARKGIKNVPCAEWDESKGQYRYYVLEDGDI